MCRPSWIHRRAQCRRISSRRARQADRACAYAEICGLFYGTFRTTDRKAVFSRHRSRTLPHGMPQIALPAVNLTVPSVQPTINCSLRGQSHGSIRTICHHPTPQQLISRTLPHSRPQNRSFTACFTESSEKGAKKAPACGRVFGSVRAPDRGGVCKRHGLRKTHAICRASAKQRRKSTWLNFTANSQDALY